LAPHMKIATFNINNVNKRLPNLLDWLAKEQPDAVCLQELKSAQREFPHEAIARAGYSAVWVGQKTWNGVAILARGSEPIVTRTVLPGDATDTQSRYIEAAVNGILIGCLYAPNGNPRPGPKFDFKLAWLSRLAHHAESLLKSGAPVALIGDYNVVPTPFDIYPTKSWDDDALVQPESREAFRKIIKQGWTDAIRTLHPDAPTYTYWDYMRNRWPRDKGLRLDHFLLSPELAQRLADGGVDRWVRGEENASDHAPAWIVLRDPPARKRRRPVNKPDRPGSLPARGASRATASPSRKRHRSAAPSPRRTSVRRSAARTAGRSRRIPCRWRAPDCRWN
jgi:exodeoxyribonuclease-3